MARRLLPEIGMAQGKVPPLIAVSVMVLMLTIVGFWGYTTEEAGAARVAHLGRVNVTLNDGVCTFNAAVTLRPEANAWAFERRQPAMRDALAAILRTKSRYMVSNPTAREALRRQMLREVNRLMAEPVADEVRFTEFVVS